MSIPLYRLYTGRLDRKGFIRWFMLIGVLSTLWSLMVVQGIFGGEIQSQLLLQLINLPITLLVIAVTIRRLDDLSLPPIIAFIAQGYFIALDMISTSSAMDMMTLNFTPVDLIRFVTGSLYGMFLFLMPGSSTRGGTRR